MSSSTVLQEDVKLCHEHLWFMYGNTGNYPPHDPAAIRDLCQQSEAKTIFDTIVNATYCEGQSSKKQDANENKAVTILSILMSGQSQKANWSQKCISSHAIAKGLSGTGLSILNQCGIGVSGKCIIEACIEKVSWYPSYFEIREPYKSTLHQHQKSY